MSLATKKITALTAGTPLDTDVIPYVDLVAGETKKALKSELKGDTGDTGPQGPQGPQGTQGPQGDVGIDWQGAWSAGTYTERQAVSHNGSSWYVTVSSTTEEPSISATDWDLIALKGTDGSGTGDVSSDTTTSVDAEIALFKSTTGKLIQRATGTGVAIVTSGVLSTKTNPSGAFVGTTDTQTLTNKRITKRVTSETSSATPTINTDNTDVHQITALATNITSMTTNLSGTPTTWQMLAIEIVGTATRTITWGASFSDGGLVNLPTTTDGTTPLKVLVQWNGSTWSCLAVA